jgi:hypothetical protein
MNSKSMHSAITRRCSDIIKEFDCDYTRLELIDGVVQFEVLSPRGHVLTLHSLESLDRRLVGVELDLFDRVGVTGQLYMDSDRPDRIWGVMDDVEREVRRALAATFGSDRSLLATDRTIALVLDRAGRCRRFEEVDQEGSRDDLVEKIDMIRAEMNEVSKPTQAEKRLLTALRAFDSQIAWSGWDPVSMPGSATWPVPAPVLVTDAPMQMRRP